MQNCKLKFKIFTFWLVILISAFCILHSPTKANAAASLSLSPATKTVEIGGSLSLTVNIDTGGVNSDAADVIVTYDSAKLTIVSSVLGNLYDNNIKNDTSVAGKITLRATSSAGNYYKGSGSFATITFQPKETGTTSVDFYFTPNSATDTVDCNIAYAGADILRSVSSGLYTIVPAGSITTEPTQPPGTTTPRPTLPRSGSMTSTVTLGIFGTFFMVLGAIALLF